MKQNELPLLSLVPEPRFATQAELAMCKTFRDAVRLSWQLRVHPTMTKRTAAEWSGVYPPHLTDYLHLDDKPSRRDLPLDKVNDWCHTVGNWVVIQFLMKEANLNVMEEIIANRAA